MLGRKQWFCCAQFDEVARQVDVKLREGKHFRYSSRPRFYAVSNPKKGFVTFGRIWFRPLSPRARCGVLVHELWHWKNFERAMRDRNKVRIALVASALPGILAAIILAILIDRTLATEVVPAIDSARVALVVALLLASLAVGVWGVTWWLVGGALYRRYTWPIEFECDEAAVRFIGPEAVIEYLKSLESRRGYSSHPPSKLRMARVTEFVERSPVPLIEFLSLEAEIPQSFDPPL